MRKPRHRITVGLMGGVLLLGGGCGESLEKSEKAEQIPTSTTLEITPTPRLDEGEGISVGDNIDVLQRFTPTPGKDHDFTLPRTSPESVEDLGIIFDQGLSDVLTGPLGSPELADASVAILLRSYPDQLTFSFVIFDTESHVIRDISRPAEVPALQMMHASLPTDGQDMYYVAIGPTEDNGAHIIFDGAEPYQILDQIVPPLPNSSEPFIS